MRTNGRLLRAGLVVCVAAMGCARGCYPSNEPWEEPPPPPDTGHDTGGPTACAEHLAADAYLRAACRSCVCSTCTVAAMRCADEEPCEAAVACALDRVAEGTCPWDADGVACAAQACDFDVETRAGQVLDCMEACGAPCEVCTPPRAPEVTGCDSEGETHVFVLHALDFASWDSTTGTMPGFNVDGCNTGQRGLTGCGLTDSRYDINQDGVIEGLEEGIDNQVTVISGNFAPAWVEAEAWDSTTLLEVSGVDDPMNDDCVTVAVLRGRLPEGSSMEWEEDGRPVADQTFDVRAASLDEEGQPHVSGRGRIEAGRVIVGPFTLPFPYTHYEELGADLLEAQVAFSLAPEGLHDGVIGGGMPIDVLTALLLHPADLELDPDVVQWLLEELADLEPDAFNRNCQQVSVGLEFAGVSAVRGDVVD